MAGRVRRTSVFPSCVLPVAGLRLGNRPEGLILASNCHWRKENRRRRKTPLLTGPKQRVAPGGGINRRRKQGVGAGGRVGREQRVNSGRLRALALEHFQDD